MSLIYYLNFLQSTHSKLPMTEHSNHNASDAIKTEKDSLSHFDLNKTAFQDQSEQVAEDEDCSKPLALLDEEPKENVTKEKYNKLKRRFSMLREVSLSKTSYGHLVALK